MVGPYTRKQWGTSADALAPGVLARIKMRTNRDDRYFTDHFQAMPALGYTRLFERMLSSPRIKILLKATYREVVSALGPALYEESIDDPELTVIFTGPIDEFFDHRFGPLPYRSARFEFETRDQEWFQPVGVVNYPSEAVSFTRIAEFKHLTGQQHPRTTIAVEYPAAQGEPYWPVPTAASAALYRQYADLAAQTPHVYFLGRLGSYSYLDMHQVVAQALKLSETLIQKGRSHADTAARA